MTEYDIKEEYIRIIKNKISINEYEAALDNTIRLLNHDPNFADGYYYQGLCRFALGDLVSSINNYEKCIELNPVYAKAYYNLGVAKYYMNKFKEALNYIEYANKLFTKEDDKTSSAKCLESIEFIKEEHGLWLFF